MVVFIEFFTQVLGEKFESIWMIISCELHYVTSKQIVALSNIIFILNIKTSTRPEIL